MGILDKIKGLITGNKEEKEEDTIEEPPRPTPEMREIMQRDRKIVTGIQEGDQEDKTEKEAIKEMIKQTKQAKARRTVRTVEQRIDSKILNETQTRPIHLADVTPNVRGTYNSLLQDKVLDERLKEDIITNREKLLRYRTTATITLIGYDTAKEQPQQAREIGIILVSNILPEEESLLSQVIIGTTGSIPHIVSQITGEISGTNIGHIQVVNSADGSNWTVTDMNIIWSMA